MSRSLKIGCLTIVFLVAAIQPANGGQRETASRTSCASSLPPGLLIRIQPDERITAGRTEGPLLFTVSSDVRLFPTRPPLIPRSSKVFAKVVESKQAGRFWGRARYRMVFDTILTPNECQYSVEAKLIEAGKFEVEKERIIGAGHARRDVFALLFPPTTAYQLLRIPARGPKLILDEETVLSLRLLDTVHLMESAGRYAATEQTLEASATPPLQVERPVQTSAAECPDSVEPIRKPIRVMQSLLRTVRNRTPYHVTLLMGKDTRRSLPPCFSAMVDTPFGEVTIAAQGSTPEKGGQREIPLEVLANPETAGWDVVRPAR